MGPRFSGWMHGVVRKSAAVRGMCATRPDAWPRRACASQPPGCDSAGDGFAGAGLSGGLADAAAEALFGLHLVGPDGQDARVDQVFPHVTLGLGEPAATDGIENGESAAYGRVRCMRGEHHHAEHGAARQATPEQLLVLRICMAPRRRLFCRETCTGNMMCRFSSRSILRGVEPEFRSEFLQPAEGDQRSSSVAFGEFDGSSECGNRRRHGCEGS